MNVREREIGDVQRLDALADAQPSAKQRDRLRMVRLALKGWEATEIAEALSSNRRTVQAWVYRYRDGGIDALTPIKSKGHAPLLAPARNAEFLARLAAGPRPTDGVCTLRARDVQRILHVEFGASYKLKSVYDLMHRPGLSCLKPRLRHEKSEPAAMQKFKQESAPFVRTVKHPVFESVISRRVWH